jgi:alpha-tubulin suppressor-like RCC1 family protein
MRDVKAAAAGYRHTMILKTDGTLWATGCNSDGEFGDSTATYRSTPVQINF